MTPKFLNRAALAAALLLAAGGLSLAPTPAHAAASPTNPYYISVSATQSNQNVTFAFDSPVLVVLANDGANEIFYKWGGTAVAGGTTSVQLPPYTTRYIPFAPGRGPASVGVICSSSETATVRVEAYADDGMGGPTIASMYTEVAKATALSGTLTVDTVTANTSITDSGLTASRLVVSDGSKGLASNGSITTSALTKSASSGASLSASSISDDGTNVTITEPVLLTGSSVQGNTTVKALTESSATTFVTVTVGSGASASGLVEYAVEANDATDFQNRSGTLEFRAVNKAGTTTITCSRPGGSTTIDNTTDAAAASTGTLTHTFTCVDGGSGVVQLKDNAVSSLTQTTLQIRYRVRALGSATLTVSPQ